MTGPGCARCGGELPPPAPTGRPRRYCSPRCRNRQAHIVARERAREQWRAAMTMTDDEVALRFSALPGAIG